MIVDAEAGLVVDDVEEAQNNEEQEEEEQQQEESESSGGKSSHPPMFSAAGRVDKRPWTKEEDAIVQEKVDKVKTDIDT